MRTKTYLPIVIAVLVITPSILNAAFYRNKDLTVLNGTPYEVLYAIRYEQSAGHWINSGWFRLAAGESAKFSARFFRIEPQFWVYAESSDGPLINWVRNNEATEPGKLVFTNPDSFIVERMTKNRSTPLTGSASEF